MPHIDINGASIHYQSHGSGPESVVFSHGLLMSGEMYRAQIDALSTRYRCIAYDHRGQGRSEVTETGYDMDALAFDAAELIRRLDAAPCHFVGLSMGGFVGLRLALHHPRLLRSVVLMDTSAEPEPEQNRGPYRRLAFVGRWFGFRWVAKPVMNILFGQTFMQDPARAEDRAYWHRHLLGLDRVGTSKAAHGVIDRAGVYDQLVNIRTPTLVLVGDEDTATPLHKSERMHAAIPGARLQVIPGAGHSASIEQPAAVTAALQEFLAATANESPAE